MDADAEISRQSGRGHDDFLERVVAVLRAEGFTGKPSSDEPVVNFEHPEQLRARLRLGLGAAVEEDDELLELVRDVVRASVRTGSRHFYNQLYGGADPFGVAGAWITEALNTSQYTFEVAPAFTLVEHEVIRHCLNKVGFPDGDGIFTPGGSAANMYGMVAARYRAFPSVKTDGMRALPPLAVFTSEDSHYSVLKGAHWLGLGTSSVVKVATDAAGRMLPAALRDAVLQARRDGRHPLLVNATAGTTVLGAVDPLDQVADVCRDLGVWLHVDACWGGSLLLSPKHAARLAGLARADSVAWNPHKMLGAPLQCSLFLVRHAGLLHRCNAAAAEYLFQQDKFYDVSWDTGDKSVQCGRKVDAFKLWLMWKARGDAGLAALVDNAMECARYFRQLLLASDAFRLVSAEAQDCTNVCFWYIPKRLRGLTEDKGWWDQLATVAPAVKERMAQRGTLLVGYCPLPHKGHVNFFRMVTTCQPPPRPADMDRAAAEIQRLGELC
ncbi:Cysteine sulfinic acid decarboxylase [Frankliniella fusca]|uniref:Cysteine sulfinic acid decarboxylase n=1 Tax=Frankliniella fusca TaxID=407009 RepID=A0AAE1GT11_9NEOP|nr:Cysteine sulfinic acid decarboxylase [Frankliniella fusca]KAK3914390.1 Cysteine sulfinic acid decarboxylase [Frankliniella fusca]